MAQEKKVETVEAAVDRRLWLLSQAQRIEAQLFDDDRMDRMPAAAYKDWRRAARARWVAHRDEAGALLLFIERERDETLRGVIAVVDALVRDGSELEADEEGAVARAKEYLAVARRQHAAG